MSNHNVIDFPTPRTTEPRGFPGRQLHAAAQVIDFTQPQPAPAVARPARSATEALRIDEVWEALNAGRVVIHYQPQFDIQTGRTVAAEALVRLVDNAGALVFPDRFIGRVERSDLIVPLGRAVIAQVCSDLAQLRAEGFAIQRVAINLAALQLNIDPRLPDFIDRELRRHQLQHSDLEFELTERQNLTPVCPGIETLRVLAGRGSRIVLDDFGIGYSSITSLTQLPISAFKLDQSMVSRLGDDPATMSVLKSLLALATELGLEVVAEGIETAQQHQFLACAGCPCGQGFGYARPMPLALLAEFLADPVGQSLAPVVAGTQ